MTTPFNRARRQLGLDQTMRRIRSNYHIDKTVAITATCLHCRTIMVMHWLPDYPHLCCMDFHCTSQQCNDLPF